MYGFVVTGWGAGEQCIRGRRGQRRVSVRMTVASAPSSARAGSGNEFAIEKLHVRTPLLRSEEMSEIAGREVLLKLENIQPSGSFKIRGIGYMCSKAKAEGKKTFVCSSGGNAGAAVAYAGKALNMPTTVCVPTSTPKFMCDRLEQLGAKVVCKGNVWAEADQLARKLSEDPECAYIPPFDHEDIWEGASSLVTEVAEDLHDKQPAAFVLSVGGGGLLLGVCRGLEKTGWMNSKILAAETDGAASLAAALEKGELVTLPEISSIAKSLGASRVSSSILPWTERLDIHSVVVSDRQAVEACGQFAVDQRLLVEPACGATLAVGYDNLFEGLPESGPIVMVVCGGNIVTPEMMGKWKEQTGATWKEVI